MHDPLVLTLALSGDAFRYFDALRERYFPPGRNHVNAHLTLFHQLPGLEIASAVAGLAAVATRQKPIPLSASALRFLGAGVACRITSDDLLSLRRQLAGRFRHWLTPQDRGTFSPHVTIQNKVAPDVARRTYEELLRSFQPFAAVSPGLDLWHYRGGPWEHVEFFAFAGPSADVPPPNLVAPDGGWRDERANGTPL